MVREDTLREEARTLTEGRLESGTEVLCGISFQGRRRKQGSGFEVWELKVSCAEEQQGEVTA